jgi:predicted amidohydrolase
MDDVRVAAAQIGSNVGDAGGNLAKHREFVERARRASADIVCFPELSLCGYPLDGPIPHDLASPIDGDLVRTVAALADESNVVVMAGMLESAPSGVLYNTQLVAIPGRGVDSYRKAHVPTSEIGRFRPGGALPVFALEKAVAAVQICYDTHFPEATTVQAIAGAEIVFMPHASTGPETREEKRARWLRYLPARAYDNGVFALVVNAADPERGFPGIAIAFDPWGEILAEASPDEEDLLVVDFRAEALAKRREIAETFFPHFRRPELYGPVSHRHGADGPD